MNTGTNVYSIIFYCVAALLTIGAITIGVITWRNYLQKLKKAPEKSALSPHKPIIITILLVFGFVIVIILSWNLLQSVTTNSSTYENPAEKAEQQQISESKLPDQKTMDKVETDRRVKTEVKPHEDVINEFNQLMNKEHDKILKQSETIK